ncbi:MAG: phytanoyl-CoA dioxygenase family protein [Alphaproteobacteria bacterium]|nr:MAG: phytanoyl-CoA dioxygenase family protein [Alphaproteobacteria bacterium]
MVDSTGSGDPAETTIRYLQQGSAVLRGVLSPDWIARGREAVDRLIGDVSPLGYVQRQGEGDFVNDFWTWRRDEDIRALVFDSPLADIAAGMLGSREVRVFYDQLLVKEPGCRSETPWHQDVPYWPITGSQILSIWIPFDAATPETGVVEYIAGSHLWGRMYAPQTFAKTDKGFDDIYAKSGMPPAPDFEKMRERFEIITWNVQPGDVIVHHGLALHHAPGNSRLDRTRRALAIRYTGTDVRWDPRPATFIHQPKVAEYIKGLVPEAGAPLDAPLFPLCRS